MNRIVRYLLFLVAAAGTLHSCHKVDVSATSELTTDVFPKTDAQFQSVVGPLYVQLRSSYSLDYWFVQSLSTDESILPAYGGNWYDGGKYMELHYHSWTKDNAWVNSAYTYAANLVGLSNQVLYILKGAAEGTTKTTCIAQTRAMRALGFWMLMDMYGNVPLDTTYGDVTLKTNSKRADVFSYIESELKGCVGNLPVTGGTTTYGQPTRYMVWGLLAKMYLNASVYTGTARNDDCIAACDSVINAGGGTQYALQSRSAYLSQFSPTNGPTMTEFVFAIPYDPTTSSGYMYHARYDLNRNLGMKYKYSGSTVGGNIDPVINETTGNGLINSMPSGARATLPSYYAYFNDATDIRNSQWLTGTQNWDDGNPIVVKTTKLGYDYTYTGTDKAATYYYNLAINPNIQLRYNATLFDVGNDEIGWNMGIRNIKFLADYTNTTSRNQSNDVPFLRYSDILLMKAEAILRGGTATNGQTALLLYNKLRAQRVTSGDVASVTLEDIYQERCREFAWECWHRNDMIRFGKYENAYGFKTNADTYRRLFPIPTTALSTNSLLQQNPGY